MINLHESMGPGWDRTITLYLLGSSANNFCKQFRRDSAQQDVGPDLDPNCLTLMVFPKEFFENVDF